MSNKCIVIDFETTGLSPGIDRAIEVAAVLVDDGVIVDHFQSLMNPGKRVSSFIESYTGISNLMLKDAPKNNQAIKDLVAFIGKLPLVAHNASFDKRFLDYEMSCIGVRAYDSMACSLLISRRLYEEAPNHKLQTLVDFNHIKIAGDFHRALSDAEMTAGLWIKMKEDLERKYNIKEADYPFMLQYGKTPKAKLAKFLVN